MVLCANRMVKKATHYETLGLKQGADSGAIRTAYRKLVHLHHPDKAKDPRSAELLIGINAAYEVLGDPERKKTYDEVLRLRAEREKPKPPVAPAKPSSVPKAPVAADVTKLANLFKQGRLSDAEALALKIIDTDPRVPVPYAVLGDIYRQRGDLRLASKMYAYALQFDPRNDLYLRKSEEVAKATLNVADVRQKTDGGHIASVLIGFGLILVACCYLVLSKEKPVLPQFAPISTWTVGLIAMLLLGGVAIGASLSVGRMLDRFQAVTSVSAGSLSPTVALASVAIINFWAMALLYFVLGASQNAFNVSTSRLVAAVAGVLCAFSAAAGIMGQIDPSQVLLWGGNLAYLGAICGWMATDSVRG